MYAEARRTGRTGSSGVHTRPDADELDGLVARYGTPLLVLDPNRARMRYRELQAAFPYVRFHYDASALAHPAVITAIAECGGFFEVADEGALAAIRASGVHPGRVVHTHPVKHPQDLLAAYDAGVRRFVVDSQAEIEKFLGYPGDLELILRLRFPDPRDGRVPAVVRGVAIDEATSSVRFADSLGVRIDGFSLLLGSRRGAQPYAAAIARTLGLMVELENALGRRFTVLDLGSDFPAAAHGSAVELAEVARAVRTMLVPVKDRLTLMAEPGRLVVSRCLTLVTDSSRAAVSSAEASASIDAGASLVVFDSRSDVPGSFFRILADSRHRIFHSDKRTLQTRAAAG
jgi:diaminopimelate decarboxylase